MRRVPSDPAVDGAPLPRGTGRHAADALLGRAHALLPHRQRPPGHQLPGRRHSRSPRNGAERRGRAALPSPRHSHGLQPRGRLGVGGGHGALRRPDRSGRNRAKPRRRGEGFGVRSRRPQRSAAKRKTRDRLGAAWVVVGFEMV